VPRPGLREDEGIKSAAATSVGELQIHHSFHFELFISSVDTFFPSQYITFVIQYVFSLCAVCPSGDHRFGPERQHLASGQA
jgi:hypothetical protein